MPAKPEATGGKPARRENKDKPAKKGDSHKPVITHHSVYTLGIYALGIFLGLHVFALPGVAAQEQNAVTDAAAMRAFEAQATLVNGQVTRLRDNQPWAISTGDAVPVQQTVSTGQDGYAQLKIGGGGLFEIFSNSKVIFRQNAYSPNDVMDVLAGRVRLQLRPKRGEQQRIFSPSAIISTHLPTSLALAVDEDDTVRIDVIEGQVRVQHTRLPSSESVLVRAIDSILVSRNEAISRRVDRGSLYRYRARILTAITFGRSGHDGEPIEGNKLLARSRSGHCLRLSF